MNCRQWHTSVELWWLHYWITISFFKLLVQGGAEETHLFQMASTRQGWGWWRWAREGGQLRQCSFSSHGALERRASCVCCRAVFFRYSDSIVTVQRLFCRKFYVERRGAILPDRNTILRWVEAFRTTRSVMKRKPPGLPCSVRTPEDVDTVRRAVLASPRRLARRQALALSDWYYFPYVIWYVLWKCIKIPSFLCN